jgi:AraC family transcriptional regulator of adaptative response / DNA-3-methyladenine glycosylase II
MRLIGDGAVDREGVAGLAGRVGYSERQLHRLLLAEVGAGAQALARAQRAHTARTLIETTGLPFADIAFAAGFASIRQFNDTVRAVFATTPGALRGGRGDREPAGDSGALQLRLPYRSPYDASGALAFLGARAVPGVETYDGATYARGLRLPHGEGVVRLSPGDGHVLCALRLQDPRDVVPAVARCRRLLDLDADSAAVDATLAGDPALAPVVAARPGTRVPGAVDGAELVVRAVLGQQVSVRGARTLAGRLVAAYGKPLTLPADGLTHHFPQPATLAGADPAALPLPARRAATLIAVCAALAAGDLDVDCGADRDEVESALLRVPGIGPWTAGYVRLRALGDPDVFLPDDLGVRRALVGLGLPHDARAAAARAAQWRPWRSYALMYLWNAPPKEEL